MCRPVLDPYNNSRDIQGIAWDKAGIDVEGWVIQNDREGDKHPNYGQPIRSYSGNFAGVDCSYMVAFAAGYRIAPEWWWGLLLWVGGMSLVWG